MTRPVFKYIVILLVCFAIAFGFGRVQQNGMGSTIEGVTDWWNGVCEWFEERTSKEDVSETTESTEPTVETTTDATEPTTEETVPEEQPPVVGDEATLIENADKSVTICHSEYLVRAQQNEMYDEQTGCGPFNIPHEDDEVYPVFFHPCEQMETLKHNHDGEKVKMMINLNKVSVFCCDEEDADHTTGVWNLKSIFCIGFDNTRVEVCKTCKGLANGDKVIGEVMELELTEEDWAEIQKVACYWWETDEESGELVRVFGLKSCTCDSPNPGIPGTPGKPGPGNPGGDDEDPTNPTEPDPTDPDPTDPTEDDPTEPTEGETDHNPDPEPTEGETAHNPDPVPTEPDSATTDDPIIDNGEPPADDDPVDQPDVQDEPDSIPTDDPIIDNGEPPADDDPVDQPDVQDEPDSTPTENPTIDNGEPPVDDVPMDQPSVNETNHNPDPVPVVNVPEDQPGVADEFVSVPVSDPVIDNGEPPVEDVPVEAPIIDNGEPPMEVNDAPVVEAQPAVEAPAPDSAPIIDNGEPPVEVNDVPVVEAQPAVEAPAPDPAPIIDNGEPPMESAHSSDPVPQE